MAESTTTFANDDLGNIKDLPGSTMSEVRLGQQYSQGEAGARGRVWTEQRKWAATRFIAFLPSFSPAFGMDTLQKRLFK